MATKPTKISFTKRSIEALKPPAEGKLYVYDQGQANLAICVTASDVRTFYRTGRNVDGKAPADWDEWASSAPVAT